MAPSGLSLVLWKPSRCPLLARSSHLHSPCCFSLHLALSLHPPLCMQACPALLSPTCDYALVPFSQPSPPEGAVFSKGRHLHAASFSYRCSLMHPLPLTSSFLPPLPPPPHTHSPALHTPRAPHPNRPLPTPGETAMPHPRVLNLESLSPPALPPHHLLFPTSPAFDHNVCLSTALRLSPVCSYPPPSERPPSTI